MTEHDPNLFTTKELVLRMETKIDILRQEMVNAHQTMVSKEELNAHLKAIDKDTERIEHQLREEIRETRDMLQTQLKEYRDGSQEDLSAFKHDINVSMTRLISILGVVIAIVQVVIALI